MKASIINQMKASKGIMIGVHMHSDGDAIGAIVGMAALCAFLSIPYQILLETIPRDFEELLHDLPVSSKATIAYDTFICLDCGDAERLGVFEETFRKAETTINIDHHETNTLFAQYNEVQKNAAASCEIVYEIIRLAECPLTERLAESLYVGILTDTGGFMHSNTTSKTHEVVAELMQVSFPFTKIYSKYLYEKPKTAALMEAQAILRMEQLCNKPYYFTYVTEAEMRKVGALKEDLGGIVSRIKEIRGCDLAIFLYPLDDTHYKVSFRSNPPYDVARLAMQFGGGGHVRAAGATLEGDFEEIVAKLRQTLCQIPLDDKMKGSIC